MEIPITSTAPLIHISIRWLRGDDRNVLGDEVVEDM
jgi:hypothetical protein